MVLQSDTNPLTPCDVKPTHSLPELIPDTFQPSTDIGRRSTC